MIFTPFVRDIEKAAHLLKGARTNPANKNQSSRPNAERRPAIQSARAFRTAGAAHHAPRKADAKKPKRGFPAWAIVPFIVIVVGATWVGSKYLQDKYLADYITITKVVPPQPAPPAYAGATEF